MNFANYFNRHFLSAILGPIKDSLHVSDGELGRIATIFMLGYTLSSPLFGFLGDRFDRKWLIVVGVVVWCAATAGTGFSQTFFALAACQLVVGLGQSLFSAVSPSLFSDVFWPAKRNSALTIFFVAIPLGSALSFIVGGLADQYLGWRNAVLLSALPGLFFATIFLPFRDPIRGATDQVPQAAPEVTSPIREIISLLKKKDYSLNCWAYTAYHFALGAYAFWGPTFLFRAYKISFQHASMFFGGALVTMGLVGTTAGGYWASRWQKKSSAGYAWVCAISTFMTAPVAILAFWAPDQLTAMIAIAASMFFAFLPTSPMNTLIIETSPVHLRSTGMALSIFLIHMCGDIWSPEIVGRLGDHWGQLASGLSILPLAFLVAAILWLLLARDQQRTA
jgi:MFS transporter, Spinster family, sphingosine-1-phosphate transporter